MNQENTPKQQNIDQNPVPEQPDSQAKNHKKFIFIAGLIFVIILIVAAIITVLVIHDIEETKRLDATSVTLTEDLTVAFGEPAQVSSFITDLQGSMVDDFSVDTNSLGEQEITFEYINSRNKKRPYTFKINVVDKTAPTIYGSNSYTVALNYDGELTNLMLSGDDLDDHPERQIAGNYDLSKVGSYNVEYVITDASGNESRQPFTINVVKPTTSNSGSSNSSSAPKLPLSEVITEFKNDKAKIGIDVSSWQGNINWQKVKSAGVEFAFIRIGYQVGYGGEYVLDKYFTQNIENATTVGLPVGIYFYSYADSVAEAKSQAEWIAEQLDGYTVELGVAFDWEDWSNFNLTGMSFHTINRVAATFLDTLVDKGYQGLLYGSLNYLRRIWQPEKYLEGHAVWLAQYYTEPTYEKSFRFWQLSSSGRVDGITGDVDLDIMYLE